MIMKYLHSQRSCKPSVPVQETTAEKRSFLSHFFINAQSSLSSSTISLSLALRLLSAGESKPTLLSRWFYASSYRSGHLFHLFPFLFPLCLRQGSRFQILNAWFGERISLVDLCLTINVVDVRISADKFIYWLHNFAVSRIERSVLFLGVKIDDGLLFISW